MTQGVKPGIDTALHGSAGLSTVHKGTTPEGWTQAGNCPHLEARVELQVLVRIEELEERVDLRAEAQQRTGRCRVADHAHAVDERVP